MWRRLRSIVGVGTLLAVLGIGVAVGYWLWLEDENQDMPPGIVAARGVLSAAEAPIGVPAAGVLVDVSVREGDTVIPGSSIGRFRTDTGETQPIVLQRGGRIGPVLASAGQRLVPGQLVTTLVILSDFGITTTFTGQAARRLPVGAEARVLITSLGDAILTGRVTAVRPVEGSGAPQATVTVQITDTRGQPLTPGIPARVYVRAQEGAAWPGRIR